MIDGNRPVLVGVGQLVERDVSPADAPTPLDLMERAARAAAQDAQLGERVFAEVDTLAVVDVVAWRPRNAVRLLAGRLDAKPRRELLTAAGGEGPLKLVNRLAREIAAGEARVTLVAGTNNVRTLRRARNARVKLEWPKGGEGEAEEFGVTRAGHAPEEAEYGIGRPTDVYPLFESALRARRGLDPETHLGRVGELMSRFSQVAASNPHAWFPVARSAHEIITPTDSNRLVAAPYTKYMNAVIDTDQSAAVVLCSADAARALGVPEDRWVYWLGGDVAEEEVWYPSERPDFARCDALGRAVGGALAEARRELSDVALFDFYSCFPVAVEMACEHLGLDEDDPRGLTLTGGLPYAGGPGNNYTLHSLATAVERLRERPGDAALVTGNGWYLTKHSATVVASAPGEHEIGANAVAHANGEPAPVTAHAPTPDGRGSVLAWTVLYDREGEPIRGVVVGDTEAGRRFIANTPEDRSLLESFAGVENVGRTGRLSHSDGRNVFDPE